MQQSRQIMVARKKQLQQKRSRSKQTKNKAPIPVIENMLNQAYRQDKNKRIPLSTHILVVGGVIVLFLVIIIVVVAAADGNNKAGETGETGEEGVVNKTIRFFLVPTEKTEEESGPSPIVLIIGALFLFLLIGLIASLFMKNKKMKNMVEETGNFLQGQIDSLKEDFTKKEDTKGGGNDQNEEQED